MADVTYEYVGDVNPNLICAICHNPFIDPVTTLSCEHTFCKSCIHESITHKSLCPIDRSQIDSSTLHDAGPVVINMLEELEVRCLGEECGYISQRGLIISHTNVCAKTVVKCLNKACAEEMTRGNLSKHRIYYCEERKMRCETCKALVPYHLDLTHKHKTPARQCGCPGNPQNGAHRWSCAEAEVPCDHAEKGCPALIKRSDLKQHLTSCLFEQITPYMNTIQEEIEGMKKDREKKSKQIDGLLRAQARLNGRLTDMRPLGAFAAASGRVDDGRTSVADGYAQRGMQLDARLTRALVAERQRSQAQLDVQHTPENGPELPSNHVSGTDRISAEADTTPLILQRRSGPADPINSRSDDRFRFAAELQAIRRARQALDREERLDSAPTSMTQEVASLPIARPRRHRAPGRFNDREDGDPIRPSRPITPPNPSSTPPSRLSDTRSRIPLRAPDSDIQPTSTVSMPSSSEVSETMATQGSITSSSSPADTADVESSDPSDPAVTINSTSGGSSRQSTSEIAITDSVARLDTSVSSSIVPGDSISNFRLPASADNRAGAITSHGSNGPSRLSEARRNEVENLATSLHLTRDSIMTYHPVALDAPGTTRATAIEIDSDPEDDLDSILDMPMFRPEAFGDMHRAVNHLVERANRMERVLQAQALSGDLRMREEIDELRSIVNVMRPQVMGGGQSLPPTPRIPSYHSAMTSAETASESNHAIIEEPEHVSIIRETIAFSTQSDAPDETSSVSSLITANNPIRRNRYGNGAGRPMGIPPELGDGTPARRVVVHRPVEHIAENHANVTPPRSSMMNRLMSRTPRSSRGSMSQDR